MLNAEGWKPASGRPKFSPHMVQTLLQRHKGTLRRNRDIIGTRAGRREHEWTMRELSEEIGFPRPTLAGWAAKGRIKARKVATDGRGTWLVWADASELERMKRMHDSSMSRGKLRSGS